jgi:hypothetical protein
MDCANNRAIKRVRCDDCRRRYERERSARRRANATRARAIQVYHSKQWAMLRKFVLDPDPICTACGERLSSQVDHILPISEGGTEVQPGRAPRNLYAVPSGKERTRSGTTRPQLTKDTAAYVRERSANPRENVGLGTALIGRIDNACRLYNPGEASPSR